jgi:hypothetical protein
MSTRVSLLATLLSAAIVLAIMTAFGQSRIAGSDDLALVRGTIYVSPTEEPIRSGGGHR